MYEHMCPSCCTNGFNLTNVKVTLVSQCDASVNAHSPPSGFLDHYKSNVRIVRYCGYTYSFFREPTRKIHVTGMKCLCSINGAIDTLCTFTSLVETDIRCVKIDTMSISFQVPKKLKQKFLNIGTRFINEFEIRVPARFPAIILKCSQSSVSASIFNSGEAVACGFKRFGEVCTYLDRFDDAIKALIAANKHED